MSETSWRVTLTGKCANDCAEALRDAAEFLSRPGENWGRIKRSRVPSGAWWELTQLPAENDCAAILQRYLSSRSASDESALLTAIVERLETTL